MFVLYANGQLQQLGGRTRSFLPLPGSRNVAYGATMGHNWSARIYGLTHIIRVIVIYVRTSGGRSAHAHVRT